MTLSPGEKSFVNVRPNSLESNNFDWADHEGEGKLSVDVAEAGNEIIIIATMSGAAPDKIQIIVNNDLLTIRGIRNSPLAKSGAEVNYLYNECYWGKFSRTIVLPSHVKPEFARAEYQNGILSIFMPRQAAKAVIPIILVDE
jgi:HSP20 family protein